MSVIADDAFGSFVVLVSREVDAARAKYPGNEHRVAAVTCEFGEAMVEYQKLLTNRDDSSIENFHKELIQLAGTIFRLINEGDRTLDAN